MDQKQDQLDAINEIRHLMKKSGKFSSLSGFAGVIAGVYALAGVSAVYVKFDFYLSDNIFEIISQRPLAASQFTQFLVKDAIIILILALVTAAMMARRRAKINGHKIWDGTAKRMLMHMMNPLIAGGILCVILAFHHQLEMLAPLTLIFYGLAMINASKFSIEHIQYLGYGEILIGLLAALFPGYGFIFWGMGFGILHMVYGLFFYLKFEH